MHHVTVDGAVSSNPVIALTHLLLGIAHLDSMIYLWRNQLVDLHKEKLKTVPELNFK